MRLNLKKKVKAFSMIEFGMYLAITIVVVGSITFIALSQINAAQSKAIADHFTNTGVPNQELIEENDDELGWASGKLGDTQTAGLAVGKGKPIRVSTSAAKKSNTYVGFANLSESTCIAFGISTPPIGTRGIIIGSYGTGNPYSGSFTSGKDEATIVAQVQLDFKDTAGAFGTAKAAKDPAADGQRTHFIFDTKKGRFADKKGSDAMNRKEVKDKITEYCNHGEQDERYIIYLF